MRESAGTCQKHWPLTFALFQIRGHLLLHWPLICFISHCWALRECVCVQSSMWPNYRHRLAWSLVCVFVCVCVCLFAQHVCLCFAEPKNQCFHVNRWVDACLDGNAHSTVMPNIISTTQQCFFSPPLGQIHTWPLLVSGWLLGAVFFFILLSCIYQSPQYCQPLLLLNIAFHSLSVL